MSILDSNKSSNIEIYNPVFSEEELDSVKNHCLVWKKEDAPKVLGRQYKSTIKSLYPLLCYIRKYVKNNIVYISQTNKDLLSFYTSQPKINYSIRQILIKKANVLCDLNSEFKPHHIAKYYYVCQENLYTMFNIYEDINSNDISECEMSQIAPAYYSFPSINSTLNISKEYSNEEIKEALIIRYPYYTHYEQVVEFLNANICNDYEKISFRISPKRSKKNKITKISIRAFSEVCLLKSLEKLEKKCHMSSSEMVVDPNILYREQYLADRFGQWEEYDIKGSVPRISRAMANQGNMGDLKEDIYKTIFELFVEDYQLLFDPTVTEWCEEVRNFFKSLFMRLFFGGTAKEINKNILSQERKIAKKESLCTNLTPFSSLRNRGVDLVALIEKYQDRVFEICHREERNKRDTSVFLHESCIYFEVRMELLKRGIDVVQVYDGFYFKKGTMPADMDEIVQRSATKYYNIVCNFAKNQACNIVRNQVSEMTPEQRKKLISTLPSDPVSVINDDCVTNTIEFIKPK